MSTEKTIEEELLESLSPAVTSGAMVIDVDYDKYFDAIWAAFPFVGSKISWLRVPNSFEKNFHDGDYNASLHQFFDEVVRQANLKPSDSLVVVGDSAMNFALILSVNVFTQYLRDIVDMPQHTYIMPPDVSWCACYTMEGYMNFGFKPEGTISLSR